MPNTKSVRRPQNSRKSVPKKTNVRSRRTVASAPRSVHALRASFATGFTESTSRVPVCWVLKNEAVSTGDIQAKNLPSNVKYTLPMRCVLTCSSTGSTIVRIIALISSTTDDNHIIGQTSLRVVGQVPKTIVLSFTKTKLAQAMNTISDYDLIKNCFFAVEATGSCKITGYAEFIYGVPIDFPKLSLETENLVTYEGSLADRLNALKVDDNSTCEAEQASAHSPQ